MKNVSASVCKLPAIHFGTESNLIKTGVRSRATGGVHAVASRGRSLSTHNPSGSGAEEAPAEDITALRSAVNEELHGELGECG